YSNIICFFFQAEDGIRDPLVTGVQTCALPISYEEQHISEILLKILLATYDLQPPWDSGHKVYGKGLLDCIQRIEGADTTVISTLDKSVEDIEDKYDFVHVILTGSKPLLQALRIFKKAMIFKHILTPSIGFRCSFNTRIYYSLMEMFQNRLIRCFSSDSVAE